MPFDRYYPIVFELFFVILSAEMKIVVDDKIPYIRETLACLGAETVYKKGGDICRADVLDADALIVRTRTFCNRELLEGTSVRFIATATIGYDHIDQEYMSEAGIRWVSCPGCNATSVRQYVECCLLSLQRDMNMPLAGLTLGIVGCGHVGSKVRDMAIRYGIKVLVNDPLIDDADHVTHNGKVDYVTLNDIERHADIITFHVPMEHNGKYATWHLADEAFFNRLERHPVIINSSRGAVVDNEALLKALDNGQVRQAVIDTWEKEPAINPILLNKVYIGTPHIAGYSADGKVNADNMVIDALCDFFGIKHPNTIVPPTLPSDFVYTGNPLQLYDPLADSERLKQNIEKFEDLRGNYPLRREFYAQ